MSGGRHPTEKTGRKLRLKTQKNYFSRIKSIAMLKPKIFSIKKLNRNTLLIIVLTIILVLFGAIALVITNRGTESPINNDVVNENITKLPKSLGAKITILEGSLQTKDKKDKWIDADKTLKIVAGTAVRTIGAVSKAEVTLEDGSILRLDANTEVKFTSLNVDRVEITQASGDVYNRVIPAGKKPYIIVTAEAQYEATDNAAFMTTTAGNEETVDVFYGSVHETVTNQKPRAGEKLTVKSYVSPREAGRIKSLNIEKIKKNSFIIWNRSLDLVNTNFKNKLGFITDIKNPPITLETPKDGDTVLLDPNATEGATSFKGKTEKGASLTVRSKSQLNAKAIAVSVESDGSFATPVISAPLGSSVFEFVSKDRVGNVTIKNIRITFQRKSQPVVKDSIFLNVNLSSDKSSVDTTWAYGGLTTAPDGIQVIWSLTSISSKPSYPDAVNSKLVVTGTTSTIDISTSTFTSGEEYSFRVCKYNATTDTCGLYSNSVKVLIP